MATVGDETSNTKINIKTQQKEYYMYLCEDFEN